MAFWFGKKKQPTELREATLPGENRTVRVVSLLRWAVVAMHTAFVVSMVLCPARATIYHSERLIAAGLGGFLMLIDLPVTIVWFPIWALAESASAHEVGEIIAAILYLVLGGFQWYWLSGLFARRAFGLERTVPRASSRLRLAMILGLLLIGVCGAAPWTSQLERLLYPRKMDFSTLPEVAFLGDSKDLRQTAIVPTLDTPMPKDKNVIWCATFQMAWDRLRKDVVREPVAIAHAEAVAARLNRATVADADLPDGSCYAAAGLVRNGIVAKIRREMQERFNEEPSDLDEKRAAIVAYAYLRAKVPFTLPYFENDKAFFFTNARGWKTQVSSFGLREQDISNYFDQRRQVEILYLGRDNESGQPSGFALDLCRDSKRNQIILACIPRQETLLATLRELEQRIGAGRPEDERDRTLRPNSTLLVPTLYWSLSHHFAELEGGDKQLLNARYKGLWVGTAIQAVDFRLDRSGVALRSEANGIVQSFCPHFRFDHPFLIVVRKRGAERPFFVMWVDNAELLCKP